MKKPDSETKLKNYVEIIGRLPVGLVIYSQDGKVRSLNEKFTELFGYTINEIPSSDIWFKVAYPDNEYRNQVRNKWNEAVTEFLESDNNFEPIETRVTCKDGSIKYIEFGFDSIDDAYLTTFVDISQRVESTRKLKDSEAMYRKLFEAAHDGIFILDEDRFSYVNKTAVRLFGYANKDDLIGKFPWHVSPEYQSDGSASKKKAQEYLNKALSGEIVRFSWINLRKDNTLFRSDISLSPIVLNDKKQVVATIKDVTEQNIAEEKLKVSESKFSKMFHTSPDGISIYDITGDVFVDVNQAFCKNTGYRRDEIVGKSSKDLNFYVEEVDLANLEKILRENGRVNNYELTIKRINKVYHYLVSIEIVIFNNKPHQLYFAKDVSSIREAEEKLVNSEKRFRAFMENIPANVYIKDENLKHIFGNKRVLDLFQLDEKDWIGTSAHSFFDESTADQLEKADRLVLKSKKKGEVEVSFNRNNEIFWERDIKFPIEISNGEKLLGGIAVDITNIKKHEADLKKAKDRAEENNKLKTSFLLNISHEIRTPMNGILGFTELLKDPELNQMDRARYLNAVNQSAERLMDTMNDIVEISKIEIGDITILPNKFSINELLDSYLELHLQRAKEKGITLSLKNSIPFENSMIIADKPKLNGVFRRLIKNALIFTDKGDIRFGGHIENGRICFFVSDTGKGISSKKLNTIFEYFVQADSEITRGHEGLGLGLAIAKAHIEKMNGSISVTSEEGKGTIFKFDIPYVAAD